MLLKKNGHLNSTENRHTCDNDHIIHFLNEGAGNAGLQHVKAIN